jgi:serine/threonine protein phosphatase 1
MGLFGSFFGQSRPQSHRPRREHVKLDADFAAVYAIGDVHGCLDLLLALEDQIIRDAGRYGNSEKAIVLLGDLIDRGPDSAGVIDHVLDAPPAGFRRIVLAGNHETAMLDFLDSRGGDDFWLHVGGDQTLRSYGVNPIERNPGRRDRQRLAAAALASIPHEHIDFLRSLPISLTWEQYLFVHAGIRPNVPLNQQTESDLQEIRDEFTTSTAVHEFVVVHGHTPAMRPTVLLNRIAVDLGAFATGRLAAVRVDSTGVEVLIAS